MRTRLLLQRDIRQQAVRRDRARIERAEECQCLAHRQLLEERRRLKLHANARLHRAQLIVEKLSRDVPITWEDVLEQSRGAVVVGRPHIADALVARGFVPSRDVAFVDLLRADGRYHVPHYAPDAPDAVAAIRAAGGVPVFAHPGADARGRIVPEFGDPALRELFVYRYRLIYRAEAQHILIVAIIHGARELMPLAYRVQDE